MARSPHDQWATPFPSTGRSRRIALLGLSAALAVVPAQAQLTAAKNQFWDQANAFAAVSSREADDRLAAALAVGDFNGDGWDDVAVGSPGEDIGAVVDAGAVFVLYGGAAGPGPAGAEAFNQNDLALHGDAFGGGSEPGDRLGEVLEAGDFDLDGYDDLAVGVPSEDVELDGGFVVEDVGMLYIVRGSADGLVGPSGTIGLQVWGRDESLISTATRFGAALAVGDLDGDSVDDLAVGAPGDWHYGDEHQEATGSVRVYWGNPATGLSTFPLVLSEISPDGPEQGDELGGALAIGDFDGDGYRDLAVGVPGETDAAASNLGVVVVLPGSASGPVGSPIAVRWSGAWGDPSPIVLAAGDWTCDGRDDLAVGYPLRDGPGHVDGGLLVVYAGTADGLASGLSAIYSAPAGERMGAAAELGPVEPGGCGLIAAGAPGHASGAGRVTAGPATTTSWTQDTPGVLGGSEAGDAFGAALAVGELGLGAGTDLVIGVPGENAGAGAFHILFGLLIVRDGLESGGLEGFSAVLP